MRRHRLVWVEPSIENVHKTFRVFEPLIPFSAFNLESTVEFTQPLPQQLLYQQYLHFNANVIYGWSLVEVLLGDRGLSPGAAAVALGGGLHNLGRYSVVS